jgi:hypothetical protein
LYRISFFHLKNSKNKHFFKKFNLISHMLLCYNHIIHSIFVFYLSLIFLLIIEFIFKFIPYLESLLIITFLSCHLYRNSTFLLSAFYFCYSRSSNKIVNLFNFKSKISIQQFLEYYQIQ